MKKRALIGFLCLPLWVFAQSPAAPSETNKALCSACHGQDGISSNPQWPNLAGQHARYLLKQMQDMKEGILIKSRTMKAILTNLSQQEMDDLAQYYAKMPAAKGSTPKQYLERGQQIYKGGDLGKHITACIACHGPEGTGNSQAGFPVLRGQHADYIVEELESFKKGARKTDINHIMRDISKNMTPEDMQAVAHYIEGLH